MKQPRQIGDVDNLGIGWEGETDYGIIRVSEFVPGTLVSHFDDLFFILAVDSCEATVLTVKSLTSSQMEVSRSAVDHEWFIQWYVSP